MRINKYVALATGSSRRNVDQLLKNGQILVNSKKASIGQNILKTDQVLFNNKILKLPNFKTIILNKPRGYVVSRNGQGSKTIYDLLPEDFSALKPIGRLDKESSGLLVLTNDGNLANQLTHPSFNKDKIYLISTDPTLSLKAINEINKGVKLEDGISKMTIHKESENNYKIIMHEGKNRQIRRTLERLGYKVTKLHRIKFANYDLFDIQLGQYKEIITNDD